MANIARGEAECYICHKTLTKYYIFHTKENQIAWTADNFGSAFGHIPANAASKGNLRNHTIVPIACAN